MALKGTSTIATFLRGEAVSAFWSFGTKGIGLLNTFLTITSLSLYQYGVFQLLLSIAGLSSDTINLGGGVVNNEISRAIAEKDESRAKKIFIEYTYVRLFIAVVLWVVVFFGAELLFDTYSEEFIKDLRVISFLFISEAVFMVMKTLAIVKLNFSFVGIRSTLNKTIQAVILVYFFIQGDLGLKQLIWSIIIASSLSVLLLIPMALKMYGAWAKLIAYKNSLLISIFKTYGTWDFVRQLGNRATFRIRPWLIKLFVGTEAVAIYSIAEMIVSTLQDVLPAKTLQSLVPFWIQDKYLGAKMFSYGVKYFIVTGIIIAFGALIVVPPVVYMFFSKYSESMPLFYFMIINLPIFAAGIILGNYLIALRRQKFLFFHNTFRNMLALLIIISTVPFIGLWGLAIEFVLVPLVMVIITEMYLRKRNPELRIDSKVLFSYGEQDKEFIRKVTAIIRGWIYKGKEKVLG